MREPEHGMRDGAVPEVPGQEPGMPGTPLGAQAPASEMPEVPRMHDLSVVVQAGGESRRMGTSKALVSFLGEPLVMRCVHRLLPICSEMVITTNEPEKMGFLAQYIDDGRIRLASDPGGREGRRGALVGMSTALEQATSPFVAMVACDMVFPSPQVFVYLRDILANSAHDVAIPRTRFGYEPFHAVYRRSTCAPVVASALESGEAKATSWFDRMDIREVGKDELVAVNPAGREFVNVNTPEELRSVKARILDEGLE